MAGRLIGEVMTYLDRHPEVTTAERLVLILIADRARLGTRRAWSSRRQDGTRDWDLARLAGMTEVGLRKVVQKLAKRWLDVRVPHGWDSNGTPIYAHRGSQVTYRLPDLKDVFEPKGDPWGPPFGAEESTEESPEEPEELAEKGDPSGSEGDTTGSLRRSVRDTKAIPQDRPNALTTPEGTLELPRASLPHAPREGRSVAEIKKASRRTALRKAAHIVEQDPDAYADRHTADQFVAWITTRHPVHDPVAYIQKLADDRAIAPLLEAMYAETDA